MSKMSILGPLSLLLAGCFNPVMTVDGRTALEQELTRTAIERAVAKVRVHENILSGDWKIEVLAPDAVDANWIRGLLRQRLVSLGANISTDQKASLPVVEVNVRFAGSDVDNFYIGIPVPGAGGKALGFYQSITERGRAGLGLTLWSADGKLLGQTPSVRGSAHYGDVFILTFIGPLSFTDLETIKTSGRFLEKGKDVWGQTKKVRSRPSPDEEDLSGQ